MDKTRENRLRRKADRQGLKLMKSPRRDTDAIDYGMYALVNVEGGGAIHPHGPVSVFAIFDLDEVETYLS